jgi:hypothetical protein
MEGREQRRRPRKLLRWMAMQCLCSGEQAVRVDELAPANGEVELQANNAGIQEAELSLREGDSLNYEVGASSCYINLPLTKYGNTLRQTEYFCGTCSLFGIVYHGAYVMFPYMFASRRTILNTELKCLSCLCDNLCGLLSTLYCSIMCRKYPSSTVCACCSEIMCHCLPLLFIMIIRCILC